MEEGITFNDKIMDQLFMMATDVNSIKNFRLMAAITKRNKVIAYGANEIKTHPLQFKFGKNNSAIYMHAEISAIKNALRRVSIEDLSKCTIHVCRVKYGDTRARYNIPGLAKPCEGCMRAILEFGFKDIRYTTDEGTIEKLECHAC